MEIKKTTLIVAGLVLIALALGIYSMTGFAVKENKPQVVRIADLPVVQGLPLYVAIEKGYFEQEGITVERVKFEAPNQIIDALLQDQVDFTAPSAATGITAIADYKNPGKLKVYAYSGANENLIVPIDSNAKSLKDLRGKKLGIVGGSIQWKTITNELLAQEGMVAGKDITIVELTAPLQVQALASKQIDGLIALEPTTTIAIEKKIGKVIEKFPAQNGIADPFYPGCGVVTEKFARENPELTKKVIRVFQKAIDEINSNPYAYKKYLVGYTPITEDIAPKTPITDFKMCEGLTTNDLKSIQKFYDLFEKWAVIDGKVDVKDVVYCKK